MELAMYGYIYITQKSKISIAWVITIVVGGLLLTANSTALAKSKSGKKADKPQTVLGTVKSVDGNSVTIDSKKGDAKQFQLTDDTTYKLKGKKGSEAQTATSADVKEGVRVAVTAKGDQVKSLLIETKPKKSKKGT
jgi:hypothetical protein